MDRSSCTTVFPGVIPDIPACRRCLRCRGRLQWLGLVPTWPIWAAANCRRYTAAFLEAEPFGSSWRLVAGADAGQCMSRRRSGHTDRTGTETGHMAGTNAGGIRCSLPAASADGLSQLCGGRAPAGSVCLPATLSDGGASGVAAVCRRPVKDPPRKFGERAFTGFPWASA